MGGSAMMGVGGGVPSDQGGHAAGQADEENE
jgi:hypothetical protein